MAAPEQCGSCESRFGHIEGRCRACGGPFSPDELPREPNVKFAVERNPEPDDNSTLYFVTVIDADTDVVLDTHTCEDGYGFVEAWREQEAKLAAHPGKYLIEIDSEELPW